MSYISPVFDVRKYGAIGDGSTNDYTAINNALAAALAADGVLYFPKGRYRVNTVLSFSDATHNITLKGDGPNVSVIVAGNGNDVLNFNFNQSGIAQPYGVVIEDLGFQALGAAGTAIIISANSGTPNSTSDHFRPTVTMRNVRVESNSDNGVLTNAGSFVVGKLHQIISVGTTSFTAIGAASNTVGVSFIATGVGSGTGTANRSNYFANGVDITACWNVCMTDCFISGGSMAAMWNNLTGYGIALHRSCVNSHFLNCHCNFWASGFFYDTGSGATDPNTEGIFFSNCSFVAVKKGVWITGNPNNTTAPRVDLVTWVGGLIELRVGGVTSGSAAFQFVHVWDVMISSMMCVTESLATLSYAFYAQDCKSVTINGCSVFSFTYGTYSANTCVAINTTGHVFTNCATQTSFTSGTTNSISGGHTLSNGTRSELNAGGTSNRIYSGNVFGATAYLTSALSTNSGSEPNIDWSATRYNDLSIWSGGNPERLTVPSGVTRVRVTCGIRWASNTTGVRTVKIKDNNANVWASDTRPAVGATDCTVVSAVVDVSNISYFRATVIQDSGAALNVSDVHGTFFSMEVLG